MKGFLNLKVSSAPVVSRDSKVSIGCTLQRTSFLYCLPIVSLMFSRKVCLFRYKCHIVSMSKDFIFDS